KSVKRYFAYTRVSTDKQGERGVSLHEQKEIIQRYATHKGLNILRWFEERETASKIGRPMFNEMLTLLKSGAAAGVIIHKVDRGARNFRDWAEIGELVEAGLEVHFATESLDLNTLGGMLSADLQAVMSVHYSRNLREEVKKGYYGRLKQGLCPRPAPLGYLNNGEGQPKTIDPVQGPIVREAFELYATGRYSLIQLSEALYRKGLRTRPTRKKAGGKKVNRTSLAAILSNPFYIGVLYVKKGDRTFAGGHEPLISRNLFEKVQKALTGRTQRKIQKHRFQFSRFITCGVCGRSLVGEIQKGNIYYRCHSRHANLTEEYVQAELLRCFQKLRLSTEEESLVDLMLAEIKSTWQEHLKQALQSEQLRLASVRSKIERLTDAYIDGMIDKADLEKKKTTLTLECREIESKLAELRSGGGGGAGKLDKIVELLKTAYSLYKNANYDEKRELANLVMSNLRASHKALEFTLRFPFSEMANRDGGQSGCPLRAGGRDFWWKLIGDLVDFVQKGEASDTPLCA
ncbi:MAG TPA: recombinase family protein, partial [Candidatus Angelobacter sp.]